MNPIRTLVIAAPLIACPLSAHATLTDLGNGTVEDSATHLIWLKDWQSLGGFTTDWNGALSYAASVGYGGSSSWALPSPAQYTTLWNDAGSSFSGLTAYFTNVRASAIYWSNSTLPGFSPGYVAIFNTDDGGIYVWSVGYQGLAALVHPSAVPEAATVSTMLAGLTLVGFFALRRRKA